MAPYGDEASTAAVFDALRDNKVRSTFFLTGEWAERNPEFVKRIVNEGHELANHSFDHPHFTRISEYEMLSQIARTDGLMESITGVVPSPYFRPPFGDYDGRVLRALGGPGYYVIYWSLDSSDWQPDSTAESVASRVIRLTEMGDIVVMHGYIPKTAEAMPVIIAGLRERGICLDTLTALLR
jgi:peptidoglycan/xylan/chitin deacetylase (PgdA/CDA1 family)